MKKQCFTTSIALALLAAPVTLNARTEPYAGPYNARFIAGGIGISEKLPETSALLAACATYTISGWIDLDQAAAGAALLSMGEGQRTLAIDRQGRLVLTTGSQIAVSATGLPTGQWAHFAVTVEAGKASFYINGKLAGAGPVAMIAVDRTITIAPVVEGRAHLSATLVDFGVDTDALDADQIARQAALRPNFGIVQIRQVGRGWALQSRANIGLTRQQDPWTLPHSTERPTAAVAQPVQSQPVLVPLAQGRWRINGWALAAAPGVADDPTTLSRPGKPKSGQWYAASVPGTVLKTLVDRGVYPDPYYGLNNLAIPESLARQDYWFRTEFDVPASLAGKHLAVLVNGVNYASQVWINGAAVGSTKGAFIRGRFYFEPVAGRNAIAIRVSPPPHPGIPHEESIVAGPGENGGQLAIDGPTFVDTEGWDWIPGIRDRDTGLWQDVELVASGPLRLGDPQVVTDLPLPRTDSADIYIRVPVTNLDTTTHRATVTARFDDVAVSDSIEIPAGQTAMVRFAPDHFKQLHVLNPKLWWPNGYGDPALHTLRLALAGDAPTSISDERTLRFGIREISYDLGLMEPSGKLERVNVQTTNGALAGTKLIDVGHSAIWETPKGYVESLTAAGAHSPAVTPVTDYSIPEPHLAIRVNGVKIAARGGNWGMDDAMKQSSRERLEPYFKLEHDAHMNIIRNWMGTNTEPVFYDLADEYGMMVLNDFWQSTQNFQIEPEDPQLFLANARDVIARYRNHPSIVLWFGRNEGVPYPTLNEGLDDAVFALDGTRWYTGSSNVVDLQGSGPYNYRPPVGYFTDLATGFSVETGSPSLSTIESLEATIPASQRWPLSDTIAYHDWHFGGNGDVKTFMEALARRFGEGTSLADFERKAQMMNVETYKAMYEGMAAHLWTKNTGRLLWMTHPAWPSNSWQIYSWDYDTHGSYYGSKKATEPLHVQLDLPDNVVAVVNTTRRIAPALRATTRVTDLDGRTLWERDDHLDAPANTVTNLSPVPLGELFKTHPMVLVEQKLMQADGTLVSRNFYWRGRDEDAYRALNHLPQVHLDAVLTRSQTQGSSRAVTVTLANNSATPALNAKLTLVDARGARVLPAFYSDNYVSLLPGEKMAIEVDWPERTPDGKATPPSAQFTLRGWNMVERGVK